MLSLKGSSLERKSELKVENSDKYRYAELLNNTQGKHTCVHTHTHTCTLTHTHTHSTCNEEKTQVLLRK